MLATAADYDARAAAKDLHNVPRAAMVGAASRDDMESLYKSQMSAPRGSARAYYDQIRNSAPNSKCPLCGVGVVRTLDHHLPKSKYPNLSVCPNNLVPSCDFCQAGKLAKHPAAPGEQTIHPYYDDYTADQWIFAMLNIPGSPALEFHVAPPAAWDPVDKQRVQRHFDVVKLGLVYTSNANDELSTLRGQLVLLASAGGTAAVQAHLEGEKDRWATRLNSWQHVTYQTLSSSPWFTGGGYLAIPV